MADPEIEEKAPVGEELVAAVRKQVEYYFSKENLQNDPYLTSQMDSQMCVPINVVMKFAKMKALTQDEAVLHQALVNSTVTIVDDKLKANIKVSGRSTIILRDVPSDAEELEVKEIFNYEGCRNISSIKSDIGDTWFVTMETEEDAKDTIIELRTKKRTFRGQSIKARLKTETVVKSFYPLQATPAVAPVIFPASLPYQPYMAGGMSADGFMPYMGMPGMMPMEAMMGQMAVDPLTGQPVPGMPVPVPVLQGEVVAADGRKMKGDGKGSGEKNRKKNRDGNGAKRKGETVKGPVKDSKSAPKAIEINVADFPPLGSPDDSVVPTPGYKTEYQKYSIDDVIGIVKNIREAHLPEGIHADEHPLSMTSTPNLDLLKRQRTFSIDETREQLRQGKPVQREAILTGAVDYRSLIFGDDGIAIGNSTTTGKVHHDHKPVKNLEVIAETTSTDNNDDLLGASDSVTENSINVTTEPVVSVQPPAVVEQPKQISPASWAAMLKSSANATTAIEVKKPIGAAKSIPQKAKTVANDSSKKSQPSGDKVNGSSSSKDEKKSDSKKKKTNNSKNGEKLASPQQKSRVQQLDEIVKKGEEGQSKAEEIAVPSTWGSKLSFANILKQASTTAEVSAQNVESSSNSSSAGTVSDADVVKGKSKAHNSKPGAAASGLWVKETLPPLPTK